MEVWLTYQILDSGGFALLGTMALAVIVWMTWNMALPLGLLSFKALRSGSESAQDKPAPLDIHVRMQVTFLSYATPHVRTDNIVFIVRQLQFVTPTWHLLAAAAVLYFPSRINRMMKTPGHSTNLNRSTSP